MRSVCIALGGLAGWLAFATLGCSHHHDEVVVHDRPVVVEERPHTEIIVRDHPPALRAEHCPPPPSPEHVWIPGYWQHDHGQYVWVPGHYVVRPHAHAHWIPETWVETPHGWRFVPGHWDK